MESSYLISVVIPTYNRAEAVCRAVRSVLDQTYSNIEVIVVDDGSTDDTQARLRQFGSQIQVITGRNAGASAARNRGIGVAHGKFIAFLDSDDRWLPQKLECQMKALRSLGEDYGVCFTDCRFVGSSDLNTSAFQLAGLQVQSHSEFSTLDSPLNWVLARNAVVYLQCLVVELGLMKEVQGLDEVMVVAEDTDLVFRLALKTKFCFVASELAEIDRTPGRPEGLMELFYQGADRMYESKLWMFKKWLSLPNLVDPGTRESILIAQQELLFEWAIQRMRRLKFRETFSTVKELRGAGVASFAIFSTLTRRAVRKLFRFGRKA
jgi:glycosyltransferase involved in cell wall biosynthesis